MLPCLNTNTRECLSPEELGMRIALGNDGEPLVFEDQIRIEYGTVVDAPGQLCYWPSSDPSMVFQTVLEDSQLYGGPGSIPHRQWVNINPNYAGEPWLAVVKTHNGDNNLYELSCPFQFDTLPVDDCNNDIVNSMEILEYDKPNNRVRVEFPYTDMNAPAQLCWYQDDLNNLSFGAQETSSLYGLEPSPHLQWVDVANPGDPIYVAAHRPNEEGVWERISCFYELDTSGLIDVMQSSLEPYCGDYCGSAIVRGINPACTQTCYESSLAIRMPRSGQLDAFGAFNRILRPVDINGRNREPYITCKNNGLDGKTCSLLFARAAVYIGGDPSYLIEARRTLADGRPDESAAGLLATSSVTYDPYREDASSTVKKPFTEKPFVEKGEVISFLYKNLHPNIDSELPMTVAEANAFVAAGRRGGNHSFDADWKQPQTVPGPGINPFWGDSGIRAFARTEGGNWNERTTRVPWFQLWFVGDDSRGTPYGSFNTSANSGSGNTDIGGLKQLRQSMPVEYNKTVDRVWVLLRHSNSIAPSGDPLIVTLKLGNSVLATASIQPDYAMANGNRNGAYEAQRTARYFLATLSQDVNLVAGNTYHTELTSATNSGWVAQSQHKIPGVNPSVHLSPGVAERRSDGGAWQSFGYGPDAFPDAPFAADHDAGILYVRKGAPATTGW